MQPVVTLDRGVSLRDLLLDGQFEGAPEIVVHACSSDSRCIQPGDLFVALTGSDRDGHDFAQQAVARGAGAVLAERLLPVRGVPLCIVPDTREAHGRICQALAGDPSHQLKVIGVGGTHGKTSTACLVASILAQAGHPTGMLGSLGYTDGQRVAPASCTTPPAPLLADWLSRMTAAGCTHAVVEATSRALVQSQLSGVQLDAACVTNVRSNHLEFHGSTANYRRATARLFDHLSPSGIAILNADDPVCADWLTRLDHPALTVGMDHDAEVTATVVERFQGEQTFLLSAGSETLPVRTRTVGDHYLADCLLAAALGLAYGIDLPTVARGLESVQQIPGRMEWIDCGQPFAVVVDTADHPDCLAAVLTALREVTPGRLFCVRATGGDRERPRRAAWGAVIDRLSDVVILTGDSAAVAASRQAIHQVRDGYNAVERAALTTIGDHRDAVRWALREARPDDCVLVVGKSGDTAGTHDACDDDRALVRQMLAAMYRGLPTECRLAHFG